MSRLQKKCLIASGALHLLLLLVLVLTPAFLMKEEEPVDQQVLTFIPDKLVDEALQRPAGNQAAPAPAPQRQPQATPPPQPKPETKPETKPEPKLERKPEPKRVDPPKPKPEPKEEPKPEPKPEPPPKPKRVPVKVDLSRQVVRNNDEAIRQREEARKAEAEKQRQEFEKQQQKMLSSLSSLETRLSQTTVQSSSVDTGTVGVSYASYDAWVRKVYMDAWRPPNDMPAGNPIVLVKVVIRRDGSIESAIVSDASGVSKLDRNIRDLLARVKTIGKPFPDGAREDKRTYTIEFNLKAILGTG